MTPNVDIALQGKTSLANHATVSTCTMRSHFHLVGRPPGLVAWIPRIDRAIFANIDPFVVDIRYIPLTDPSPQQVDRHNLLPPLPSHQARWSSFEYPSLITSSPGRALPSCPFRIVPSRISRYCRIVYWFSSYTTALGPSTSVGHVSFHCTHIFFQTIRNHGRNNKRCQCSKASRRKDASSLTDR